MPRPFRRRAALVAGAVLVTLATAAVTTAHADEPPPPGHVLIKKFTYGGTGCPAGTVTPSIAADGRSMTLRMHRFVGEVGPGIELGRSRAQCQLNILLKVPTGFTFAVSSVEYAGYALLDQDVTAERRTTKYFQGERPTAPRRTTTLGPVDGPYLGTDAFDGAELVYAPCGVERAVNLRAEMRLHRPAQGGSGFVGAEGKNGFQATANLVWAICPT